MTASLFPTIFVSHGGGPWPFIAGLREQYAVTARELAALPQRLPARPSAIVVISGHWIAQDFAVSTAARPPMEYDYSGFPAHTYHLQYPAPGSPELAARIATMLRAAGVVCGEDSRRGFDHGVFVPLGLMFPEADVPVVMLAVRADYDPAAHLRVGRALVPLRRDGVLIIGSGLTYHNMRGFGRSASTPVAAAFEQYLHEAVTQTDPQQREALLRDWETAPGARAAHPQEDHLVPLLVAAGAAGTDVGRRLFVDHVMQVAMASYQFG